MLRLATDAVAARFEKAACPCVRSIELGQLLTRSMCRANDGTNRKSTESPQPSMVLYTYSNTVIGLY
eukprot:COSAG02_NODE_6057_length_3835_cov_11.501071_2_plen_67_part_00